ncbi:hypothetical protein EOM71_00430 [Candidatus Falkowbacteria bacterium]|nr:hypothetical protein [Candidatus Falkowbacteria bacterium]
MDEDLRRTLAEQAAAITEIRENTRLIYKYIYWQKIFRWFKLAIIIVPLIIGAIYLPPLLKDLLSMYSSILP